MKTKISLLLLLPLVICLSVEAAVYFNNNYISLGTSSSLDIADGESFTIALRVKTTDTGWLFGWKNTGYTYPCIDMNVQSTYMIPTIAFDGGTNCVGTGTEDINDGKWHFVALRFDNPNNTFDTFVGTQVGNAIVVNKYSAACAISGAITTNARYIAFKYNTTAYLNPATITEVAFWKTALTDAEITQSATANLKRLPLQIQQVYLKMYLPLDDKKDGSSASGSTYKDLSGSGNSGTNQTGYGINKAEEILSYPK